MDKREVEKAIDSVKLKGFLGRQFAQYEVKSIRVLLEHIEALKAENEALKADNKSYKKINEYLKERDIDYE